MWPSRPIRLFVASSLFLALADARAEPVPATIYRCEIGGTITFSDRPCDAGAQRYEPDISRLSTYTPPRVSTVPPAARVAERPARKGGSIAAAQAKHAAECARLRANLKELRSKMRAGYRAKEGERLRQRQSTLQARLRAARC